MNALLLRAHLHVLAKWEKPGHEQWLMSDNTWVVSPKLQMFNGHTIHIQKLKQHFGKKISDMVISFIFYV